MNVGAGVVDIEVLYVGVGLMLLVLDIVEEAGVHEPARTAIICVMRAKIPSLCLAITSGRREEVNSRVVEIRNWEKRKRAESKVEKE